MKPILRKTVFFVLAAACSLSVACLEDEATSTKRDEMGGVNVPSNDVIDARLFEVVNLDYPGLERVKEYYEQGRYYFAAQELLDHFRARTALTHPDLNLLNPTISETEKAYADFALSTGNYRFYVPNFWENATKLQPYSYQAADKSIDWTVWPTKQNEQRYQVHRHYWFEMQARAFRITRDEKYALGWMEVYADWLAKNPRPDVDLDYGKDPSNQAPEYQNAGFAWRPLEAAHRLEAQTGLMYYFSVSTSLTPEWFSKLLVAFADHANHVLKFKSTSGNHLVTQGCGVFYAGVLYPEFKDAQTWYTQGAAILDAEIVNQFHTDGMLKELDLSYHMGEIDDFYRSMRLAQTNNKNAFTPTYTEQMPKLTNIVMDMTFPDFSIPNMGDTRCEGKQSVMKRNFKRYYEFFPGNSDLAWRASEGTQGNAPAYRAASYDVSGYYILRSGWAQTDAMMILKNGPRGEGGAYHNQPDNGTFELYINGRNFFPDAGCYAYSGDAATNAKRNKYRATRVHNTMTLGTEAATELPDDNTTNISSVTATNLKTLEGKLLQLKEAQLFGGKSFDVLVTENQGYPALKHRRAVFFSRDLIVLVDEGIGDAEAPVNVNYHLCDAKTSVAVDAPNHTATTSFGTGENIKLQVFGETALSSFAFGGQYSPNIGKTTARWGITSTQQKTAGAPARFITVIAAGGNSSATLDASFTAAYDASGASVRVTVGGTAYDLTYTLD